MLRYKWEFMEDNVSVKHKTKDTYLNVLTSKKYVQRKTWQIWMIMPKTWKDTDSISTSAIETGHREKSDVSQVLLIQAI